MLLGAEAYGRYSICHLEKVAFICARQFLLRNQSRRQILYWSTNTPFTPALWVSLVETCFGSSHKLHTPVAVPKQEPVSVPRLSRPSAGGAAASPVAPPAVVSLPGLDETSGEHPTGRQWNIPPEVADGTPARAARRGRRGALVDASNEPEEDASEGGDMDAQAAALSDPKAGASRRSTRAQRGKENPAAPAVKTEPVAATRSGRATRKRRA